MFRVAAAEECTREDLFIASVIVLRILNIVTLQEAVMTVTKTSM